MINGGKLKEPGWLNERSGEYLEEFHQAQDQLIIPVMNTSVNVHVRHPPPASVFKLNFDAAILSDLNSSGVGAMIRNEKGEVMVAMSPKGPLVGDRKETEILACRKALEFAIDASFSEVVNEGDNANVMKSISSTSVNQSRLGHIIEDIQSLAHGLRWVNVSAV